MAELRKYAISDSIEFILIDFNDTDFEDTPVSFVEGDSKISKDNGTFVNTTNLPTHTGEGKYSLTLTSTELTAKKIIVTIKDISGAAWEDQAINVETYGSGTAQHDIVSLVQSALFPVANFD